MKNLAAKIQRAAAEAVSSSARQGALLAREKAPVDSGELSASIRAEGGGLRASVITGAAHAAMVEYGTSRMAPQPFMLSMAQDMRGRFIQNMRAAVREVVS